MGGVLGLEGQHEWNGSGLILNRPREDGYPRWRVRAIPGLHSLPDADDNREQRQGAIGEKARPSLPRGKTVTYEGEVQALTLPALRQACDDMRWAFGDRRYEARMDVRPAEGSDLGVAMFYRARCTSLEIDEEQTYRAQHQPSPWCRPFVLSLRMADPRFFDAELQVVEALLDDGQASTSVTHIGSAPADPLIYVHGPTGTDWSITGHHDHRLDVTQAVGASDSAIVDFYERRITVGGNDWTGRANATSNWWDEGVDGIPPRSTHDITLRSTASDGIRVEWRHTYW